MQKTDCYPDKKPENVCMANKKDFEPIPPSLKIGKEVSRGSFGVVFLATLDKKPVAVKQFHEVLLSADSVPLQNFKRECEQLKRLNHPNIVKYIGAYQGKRSPSPILVMEQMHETLKEYLERNKGNLSPDRVMEICSAVCEGLAFRVLFSGWNYRSVYFSYSGYKTF